VLAAPGGDPSRRNHVKHLLGVALAAAALFSMAHADFAGAARMGGGRSFGMQRSIVPPAARSAPSTGNVFSGPAANPVLPASPGAPAARLAPGTAAPGAASRSSRWLGPVAGLAAGLGLAALFSHLGLSEGLASLLLAGILVIGVIALLRAFAARRVTEATYPSTGAGTTTLRASMGAAREPTIDPAWGSPAGDARRYPVGFDAAPFIAQAKQQFRRLQSAYDRGDRTLLADVTTPDMQAEITRDLAARGPHVATGVVTLDADIIEVVQEGDRYVATVRFHGALREDGNATPRPFEELWHLVKPVDGSSGWLLAGIQQYA
jgi:predicted lipid-binding transport protein (Tim44 family)